MTGRRLPPVQPDPPPSLAHALAGIRRGLTRAGVPATPTRIAMLAAHSAHEDGQWTAAPANTIGKFKATDSWISGGGDYAYLGGEDQRPPFPVAELLTEAQWKRVDVQPRTDGPSGPDAHVTGRADDGRLIVQVYPDNELARFRAHVDTVEAFTVWAHTLATGRYGRAVDVASTGSVATYVDHLVQLGPYFGADPGDYQRSVAQLHRAFLPIARGELLSRGDRGPSVRALQRTLGGLDVDGDFGPATEAAVEAEQRRHGIAPTGVADADLWRAMAGEPDDAPSPSSRPPAPPAPVTEPSPPPSSGDGPRILLYLVFADPRMNARYEAACAQLGLDVELVNVSGRPGSNAHRQLVRDVGGTLEGWLQRYPATRPYDVIAFASFSAGYGVLAELLRDRASAEQIAAYVAIDSYHAGLDADGTARDADLAQLVAYGLRAREPGGPLLWLGHTDVPTPQTGPGAFASTTQVAHELVRLVGVVEVPAPVAGEHTRRVWASAGGFRVASYDMVAPGARDPWVGATQEHSAALTTWGPGWVADALVELSVRWEPSEEPPEPLPAEFDERPLGVRALEIAREEQLAGVRELPGAQHHPRILEYFSGCEREGRLIGPGFQRDEWAWCAAAASWCAFRAAREGEAPPHRWRASVRELWADAIASHAAVSAAALRRGEYVPQPGDLWIQVRGGYRVGPPGYPFAHTKGLGHVGRVVSWDTSIGAVLTLDGNINDTWWEVRRRANAPELVGVIRYPRPEAPPTAPGPDELAELRRLDELEAAWRAAVEAVKRALGGLW